jgi:hypothetical protein
MLRPTFAILLTFLSIQAMADGCALVEAESFENCGGWVVDQQFMDLMGSPYLLAHGLGEPVTAFGYAHAIGSLPGKRRARRADFNSS